MLIDVAHLFNKDISTVNWSCMHF